MLQVGIRVIIAMTNHEAQMGGTQWWAFTLSALTPAPARVPEPAAVLQRLELTSICRHPTAQPALESVLMCLGAAGRYVDRTIKKGQPKALFYTAAQPRAAYKHYVRCIACCVAQLTSPQWRGGAGTLCAGAPC